MATFTFPSPLFLLFSIIFLTKIVRIGAVLTPFVLCSEPLLELRISDFRRRLDIVRCDNSGRYGYWLGLYIAGRSSCYTKELEDIVKLTVKIAADGDWCGDGLNIGF